MLLPMVPQPAVTRTSNLVRVVRELPADLETPVSIYLRLAGLPAAPAAQAGQMPSFLLESVTGGEQVARYSFIGVNPSQAYILRGQTWHCISLAEGTTTMQPAGADPLNFLRARLARCRPLPAPDLPRLAGGLVGYLGYDTIRYFEPSVAIPAHADLPDAVFLLADTVVAFDHAYQRLLLITNVPLDGDAMAARATAEARLDKLQQRLAGPLPAQARPTLPSPGVELHSNMTQAQFAAAVARAKEYIAAGDIFQVVLSQRLTRETTAAPFAIYRALRRLNPSPYMFFFDFANLIGEPPLRLIGASPEMHVRLEGRQAAIRPIAGTRPRGQTPVTDQALAEELLADPKERAEHVMLVDLARNDLGRVCEYDSVHVSELMGIERYSHVMHIVSHVEGLLRPEYDAFDLLQATFPAGTVSGAPKIRAMQIIAELEGQPRGPYAGAVGYCSYDGSLDTCIAIRTLVMRGQTVSIQAGAGIVADSEPQREYQETLSKAQALATAVQMAENTLTEQQEDPDDRCN